MSSIQLVLESKKQYYKLPEEGKELCGQVDEWAIAEHFAPGPVNGYPPEVGRYWLILQTDVSSHDILWKKHHSSYRITDELDRAWVYACGRPFLPVLTELAILDAPKGWTSNYKQLDHEFARREGGIDAEGFGIESRHWLNAPHWPLRPALTVLHNYRRSDESVRGLVELHYRALKSTDRESRLNLLAKGLEFGHAMIGGRSKKDTEKRLNPRVREKLRQSLTWLFKTANTRSDLRHVVSDAKKLAMYPKLTRDESVDFCHDADLILRGIVSDRLVIPLVLTLESVP